MFILNSFYTSVFRETNVQKFPVGSRKYKYRFIIMLFTVTFGSSHGSSYSETLHQFIFNAVG